MRRIGQAHGAKATLVLLLAFTLTARSADDMARTQVMELNHITGSDSYRAKIRELRTNPSQAKKLIEAGLALAKEKNQLQYNAALILAQAAAEVKNYKASEAFYRVCADLAVKLYSTRKLVDSYGGLIALYYDAKKYDESVRICRELLELKTDDGKPRDILVAIKTRFGDVDFAPVDSFNAARPLHARVHHLLIQGIAKQGKHDQALKLVENLIKTKDHWEERELKAWVLNDAARFEEAAKAYEDVIDRIGKDRELEADEKDYYLYRNRTLLSHIYVEMKQIEKGAEQLELLLQKKPNDPGLHNDLGYVLADHDLKLDYAEKLIRKALELDRERRQNLRKENPEIEDRDNGAYLDSLGWVLFKQKKFKEAKQMLLKAIEDKNSQHIEIYDHLGDVHLALGEREAALAAWRKGLEVVGEGRREMERKAQVEKKIAKHSAK